MEDTDHKDVWQCGTFPWSQSLLVGFGIGALLAYNFVQRDRLLQTRLYQKEMAVTFSQFSGKIWLQEAIFRFRSLLNVSFSACNTWGKRRDTPCVIPILSLDPENTAAFSHYFLSWLLNRCTSRRWWLKAYHIPGNLSWIYTASLPHENLQHTEGNKLFSCLYSFANQIWWVIISSNPILVNRGVILGRWGVDVGSMWGRCRVDVGSMWGRCRVDVGSMWGRCRVDVGSMWGRCGIDVGSMWGRCGIDIGSM